MALLQEFIASTQADANDGNALEIFVKWFPQNGPKRVRQVEHKERNVYVAGSLAAMSAQPLVPAKPRCK